MNWCVYFVILFDNIQRTSWNPSDCFYVWNFGERIGGNTSNQPTIAVFVDSSPAGPCLNCNKNCLLFLHWIPNPMCKVQWQKFHLHSSCLGCHFEQWMMQAKPNLLGQYMRVFSVFSGFICKCHHVFFTRLLWCESLQECDNSFVCWYRIGYCLAIINSCAIQSCTLCR